jgi:hypothetical protein
VPLNPLPLLVSRLAPSLRPLVFPSPKILASAMVTEVHTIGHKKTYYFLPIYLFNVFNVGLFCRKILGARENSYPLCLQITNSNIKYSIDYNEI